jgi:hypothetical protein
MMKALRFPRSETVARAHPDLMRKADLCTLVLAEARRIAEVGQFGGLLSQLVVRAVELLDDMDDILIGLNPASNGPNFTAARRLHRELEHIQAAILAQRRAAASKQPIRRNPVR